MRPRDYDINLDYSDSVEIRFVIDPNQINDDLPKTLKGRFDTPEEAKEVAQLAANLVGHEVEIEAAAEQCIASLENRGAMSIYRTAELIAENIRALPTPPITNEGE